MSPVIGTKIGTKWLSLTERLAAVKTPNLTVCIVIKIAERQSSTYSSSCFGPTYWSENIIDSNISSYVLIILVTWTRTKSGVSKYCEPKRLCPSENASFSRPTCCDKRTFAASLDSVKTQEMLGDHTYCHSFCLDRRNSEQKYTVKSMNNSL